jgi:hypothetical protein
MGKPPIVPHRTGEAKMMRGKLIDFEMAAYCLYVRRVQQGQELAAMMVVDDEGRPAYMIMHPLVEHYGACTCPHLSPALRWTPLTRHLCLGRLLQ